MRGYDGWFRLIALFPVLPRVTQSRGRGGERERDPNLAIGFAINRQQDAATQRLVSWVTDGTLVREVTADFIKDGSGYLRYRFTNLTVTSIAFANTSPGAPTESSSWSAEAFSIDRPS